MSEILILDEKGYNKNGKKIEYIIKNECWECISHNRTNDNNDYPQVRRRNKGYKVHRYSYILHKGEIPDNMYVMHKCDNIKCINPDHLKLGTHQDNMADRDNKGRGNKGKNYNIGDSNPMRKKARGEL